VSPQLELLFQRNLPPPSCRYCLMWLKRMFMRYLYLWMQS